ncbi:hypothetical protein JZ785_03620 [Alicyclobacillus curvatus]|nr:hypothetical protein JZ785_03620 [Alicyclobacillus curvatus]
MAASDALYASDAVHSNPHGEWRREKESHEVHGNQVTLNAHLYISPEIMASNTSVEEFRAFLDHHVFLWPTLRLCGQMLQMYIRREPGVFHPEIGCPPYL